MADRAEAREAYAKGAWTDAYSILSSAPDLGPEDLIRLAVTAYLVGDLAESDRSWEAAHERYMEGGDHLAAARCAFWIGLLLVLRGDGARGGGWLTRGQRLVDRHPGECVERGYLLVPSVRMKLDQQLLDEALEDARTAAELAERYGEPDLLAFARLGEGQTLLSAAAMAEGLGVLDEAMVAATREGVSPLTTGIVYCALIITCQKAFDIDRAREWTTVLSAWCDDQPDLVPFRGQCLVHRSEILQMGGAWREAMAEVDKACRHLARPEPDPVLGLAHYQKGELHRLRGEFEQAEVSYQEASRWGHDPQPGHALMRLAAGKAEAAGSTIRRLLAEATGLASRSPLLAPYVEIMLAVEDFAAARKGADELAALAGEVGAPLLTNLAHHAQGAVSLAEGDAQGALTALRQAARGWRDLGAPYREARTRELIGHACRAVGDTDGADLEWRAALSAYRELGASPDLRRLGRVLEPGDPGGLTAREMDVVILVAKGCTNRDAATRLGISERTVERHLSNVFSKLGVSNRAAATAYAYEHDLL